MKKRLQSMIAILLCAILLLATGCTTAAPEGQDTQQNTTSAGDTGTVTDAAAPSEEGKVYNIRVAVGKQYCGEGVVKAGDVLNKQLEAEGSKDVVNVEFIVVESLIDSFTVWSRENNLPELAVDSIKGLNDIVGAGYTIDNAFVVNDEAYSEMPQSLRNQGRNYYDQEKYDAVTFDTEFRMVMIYKPALQQLGWTEEQIEQWKQDARAGKVTTADLQNIAKQIVDAGICEFGITHRPEKCADNRFFFVTWAHGIVPTNAEGQVIVRKSEIRDYLNYWRTNVQMGLTPYNFMTDYNADMLYNDILPQGKAFAYYGHIEIKSRMMKGAGVSGEYVDENYFSIPAPVSREGDQPVCGSNPRGITMTTAVESNPQLKEYCRRLMDCLLDDEVQLDLSLRSGHVAILSKTMETEEYKADKWMYDTDYVFDCIFSLPAINSLLKYADSQELYNAYQEAELKALDPNARSIDAIVDEVVELMIFNMDDGSYIVEE